MEGPEDEDRDHGRRWVHRLADRRCLRGGGPRGDRHRQPLQRKTEQRSGGRQVLPRRHPHARDGRDLPQRAAASALAPRRTDGRAALGGRSGLRRRRELARDAQPARGGARGGRPARAICIIGRGGLWRPGAVSGA